MIALLLVTAGVSAALLHSVAPVLAGRLSGRRLGYGMGFWMVGGEVGRTLGPIVMVSAIAVLGLEGMPWLMVGGFAASALLFFGLRGVSIGTREPATESEDFFRVMLSMRPLLFPLMGIVIVASHS